MAIGKFKPVSINSVQARNPVLAEKLRDHDGGAFRREDGQVQRSEFRKLSRADQAQYRAIADEIPPAESEQARSTQRMKDLKKLLLVGGGAAYVALHFTPAAPILALTDFVAAGIGVINLATR